jgi:hypothetical protein
VRIRKRQDWSVAKAALLVVALSLAVIACGFVAVRSSGSRPAGRPVAAPPARAAVSSGRARSLSYASSSVEELVRNAMRAVSAGDKRTLTALRITEAEFREYVWPELPASKVPNVTVEFAWNQASLNNHAGYERVLQNHQGRLYEFVSIRFLEGVTDYATFRVHNKAILTVRDEAGQTREVRLFGSVLELDGQYKLFSYVAD